jgi:hypothetical protein
MNKSELAAVIKKLVKEHKSSSAKKGLTEGKNPGMDLHFTYLGFDEENAERSDDYVVEVGGWCVWKCDELPGMSIYLSLGANGTRMAHDDVELDEIGVDGQIEAEIRYT